MKIQQSASEHPLIRQLVICGQVAEHKGEKAREHGLDEEVVFSALTEKEKADLSGILCKLQAQWAKDHAEHSKKN